MLGFFSYRDKLSALWSRGTWPDYSRMRSCAIWGFERWSSHASLPVCFRLSVQAVRCCSHLTRPCEVFHSSSQEVVCIKIKQMQQKIYFIVWNIYECIMQPPEWSVGYAAGTNKKCTIKNLITYKRVLTDHCSKNLELRSHPLAAIYMNQVESSRPLHMDPPKLVKAYGGL
jgi:hypothetical protein